MPFNDTWGDISPEELAKMRANAEPCVTCGMLATVNPVLHENRYGHAPVIARDGRRLQWHAGGPQGPGWAEVDTASSASRQHYTKTGRYLLRLTWERAHEDEEPRDQNADTELVEHGYWQIGPQDEAGNRWAATLVEQNASLDEIGCTTWYEPDEAAAKARAQTLESFGLT